MKRSWNVAGALCLAAIVTIPALASFSGSIQTTNSTGTLVNGNIYNSKDDVYLTGGPQNQNASGLPDGIYYFQVTDPNGGTLLSTDAAQCRQVIVAGGKVAHSYDGTSQDGAGCSHAIGTANPANGELPVKLMPYNDTPNNGGEYKAWLIDGSCATPAAPDSPVLNFDGCGSKTDNFKIKGSGDPGTCGENCTTIQTTISGHKCYDYNGPAGTTALDGICQLGEALLDGWHILVTYTSGGTLHTSEDHTTSGGAWSVSADESSTLTACEVLQNNWKQTGPPDNATTSTFSESGGCWTGTVPSSPVDSLDFANVAQIKGTKYYDTNANGAPNSEPTIQGFKIQACFDSGCPSTVSSQTTDSNGNYAFYLPGPASSYKVGEVVPASGWAQTGPLNNATPLNNLGSGAPTADSLGQWGASGGAVGPANGLYFMNVCFVKNGKALTLGFWSNKNGQNLETAQDFIDLTALHLRNGDGSSRDFTGTLSANKTALNSFLLGANATNMANMLSAQLAAMKLNVNHGLNPNLLIYAPGTNSANAAGYATIAAVMAEADGILGSVADNVNLVIGAGDPLRTRAEAVKTALDNANNSKNIVGSGPGDCPPITY